MEMLRMRRLHALLRMQLTYHTQASTHTINHLRRFRSSTKQLSQINKLKIMFGLPKENNSNEKAILIY